MSTHLEKTALTKESIEQSRANIKLSIASLYALLFLFWAFLFISMYKHTEWYSKHIFWVVIFVAITSTIIYVASDRLRDLLLKYNWVTEEQMMSMYYKSATCLYVHKNFLETVCERPFLTVFEYDMLTKRIDDELMVRIEDKKTEKPQWLNFREQLCTNDRDDHG